MHIKSDLGSWCFLLSNNWEIQILSILGSSHLKIWLRRRMQEVGKIVFLFLFFKFYFYFILLYNTVLVLPYIDMNPPWVYTSSQSWIPLPPSTPYHLSGSSPCTSPKHPVSCIKHRVELCFLHDSIHVSMPFSQIIPPSPSPSPSESKNTNTVY